MPKDIDGLKIAYNIATERQGKCLSIEYVNNRTKMRWCCKEGHIWEAKLNNIKDGKRWCPKCGHKKSSETKKIDGLKIAQEVAKSKGGLCLSNVYTNINNKLKWKCSRGHIWYARLNAITSNGSWCSRCVYIKRSKLKKESGFILSKQIAKSKGGRCLSKKYYDCKTPLLWECEKKHQWYACLDNIKNSKQWCPECGRLKAARSQNNSYTIYHWKTGEELVCQASWEKAVVEYLNANKINFRWQPRSFKMPDGRKYYPDMYLYSTRKWVEIKGYFRKGALEKWEWFQSIKPNSELWDKGKLKKMGIL